MLTLTTRVNVGSALGAVARLDRAALRASRELPADALAHEAGILSAASPVRTGLLASSYVVRPTLTGATLTNAAPYFGFNLFGTGRRGAASGVPQGLFPDGWHYGDTPGMAASPSLLRAWADAPAELERYTAGRIASLF